jgi:hypothetical protein
MSDRVNSRESNGAGSDAVSAAEATLRLLARLPVPEGLEYRTHARLRSTPPQQRVLKWPLPVAGEWMRAAAAAAIVCVVAGGGWGVFLRVHPGQALPGMSGPSLAVPVPGGFTEGGAVRRPQTLAGPTVAEPRAANTAPKPKAPSKSSLTTPKRATPSAAGKLASPSHSSVSQ